jgi:gliding motility-associated-like protein
MYLRKLILSFLFLFLFSFAFSQREKDGNAVIGINTTQIVNVYTTLTTDINANTISTISVANTNGFSAGDLVLIIQMQGAWANYASADSIFGDPTSSVPVDSSFGRIIAYNGAGNNEIAEILSVNSGSNTIVLNCQIGKSFKASGKTQLIRVPRYSNLTIDGTITCPPWDRTLGYGGVIAIEVTGNTTINSAGKIDASGLGFRGGAFWYKNSNAPGSTLYGTTRRNEAGNKGESIAGDTNVYANEASKFGRGAIANGGGGGNATNSGGGGGSNAGFTNKYFGGIGNIDTTTNTNYITAWNLENNAYPGVLPLWRANINSGGGRGGYSYSNSTSDPLTTGPNNTAWNTSADKRRSVGGFGGRPLDYSNNRLFLGGGGGSGDGDNYYQGAGGNGGGIIYFISYGNISGSGQIIANGANGSNTHTAGPRGGDNAFALLGRDGAGGGGGGGAITIKSTGSVTGISVSAVGGNGGNASLAAITSTNNSYGPGGGGGGGYINLPTATLITNNVNGGNNGIVTISGPNSSQIDNKFPPNGATKGGPGIVTFSSDIFNIMPVNDTICGSNSATLYASIIGNAPTGTNINWFTSSTGGTSIATGNSFTTPVLNTTTDYWIGTCPGTHRVKVTVVVNSSINAPSANDATYCQNETVSALTPNGTGYNWYDVSTGGTAQTSITPSTTSIGTTTYYVSQGSASCESPRTAVLVNVVASPAGPQVSGPIVYCQNTNAQAITLTPSVSGNTINYWGTNASGGTASTTPTIPSTGSVGTTTYYFSESNGTCESNRTSVDVVVNAIPNPPTVTDTIAYCQNQTATALTPSGASILWYTSAIGGVGTTTSPVPSTTTTGVTTYYVSQTQNNCESNRDSVKVVVNTGFSAPTASGVTYCLNATAQSLSPNGTGYNWYDLSIGGVAQTSITPSTANIGTTTYYVSQGNGSCESPRTAVDVVINAIPNQPIATDEIYCINETPGSLIVNSTGGLTWYNQGSGGVGFTTDPTVNTSSVGSFNYFVSQTINGCESNRDTLTVTVIDLQNPPLTQSVIYCKDDVAISLTANGTSNLNWWGTNAIGGTSTGIAPVPNTAIAGTTTYYVSQGTGACESPRVPLTVTVTDLPSVSFTQSANSICVGKCIVFNALTSATCTNLSWNFGNGSTSNNTSETICFNNAGSFDVSLRCTDANGCINNSIIQNAVIVDQTPVADFSITPGNIVSTGSSVIFMADTSSAIGASYEWYFDDASSGNLNTSTETNPNHVYNNTGNYCIVLIASLNNCRDTISKCIDVLSDPKIIIPNLFTPNGDGINDLFLVTADGITQFEIQFFDRWGELVFNSKSINVSWDGKNSNGKKVSDGVYYYIVTYTDFKNQTKTLTGFLSLIGD